MRHTRIWTWGLAALFCASFIARAEAKELQGKIARCPELAARLAELELGGASETRLRGLRNRIAERCVSLNETQVLGTHNSYHIQPQPALLSILETFDPSFSGMEYTHIPLYAQFETQAIRQIELDVFADPAGGLYERRGGMLAINQEPHTLLPSLMAPGFKVLHVQDIDFDTTCYTFVECLKEVRRWSNNHRRHLPIMILVEAKDDPIPDPFDFGFAIPVPIGPAQFDAIDAEIRSVFGPRRLITPDDIRRGRPTLEDAVLNLGWPNLHSVRGRVMFTLDNGGQYRADYLAGHPSLQGRVMFTDSTPGSPEAAFVKMNDPLDPAIPTNVAAGYVVRTRADADTVEARVNNTAPRDAAIASGAQWVSTDYPVPNPAFGTGYMVSIPGGSPARCNPVNAPAACRSQALERPPSP